jgi:hypothetical protein
MVVFVALAYPSLFVQRGGNFYYTSILVNDLKVAAMYTILLRVIVKLP